MLAIQFTVIKFFSDAFWGNYHACPAIFEQSLRFSLLPAFCGGEGEMKKN